MIKFCLGVEQIGEIEPGVVLKGKGERGRSPIRKSGPLCPNSGGAWVIGSRGGLQFCRPSKGEKAQKS